MRTASLETVGAQGCAPASRRDALPACLERGRTRAGRSQPLVDALDGVAAGLEEVDDVVGADEVQGADDDEIALAVV